MAYGAALSGGQLNSVAKSPVEAEQIAQQIAQGRIDLAASFRWFARLGMSESVANHSSLAVPGVGTRFLINPCRMHFSRITARDLLLLDAEDPTTLQHANAPDPTAWYLHSRLHAHLPQARCVIHLHSKYASALGCLLDNTLYPIDINTARFFGRVAVDEGFAGMALSNEEADRQCRLLGAGKTVLVMANHGVLVIGPTVADAFDEMYYFERAAETLLTCYATGKPLRVLADEVARLTERQWRDYADFGRDHLNSVKAILDREEPTYRE